MRFPPPAGIKFMEPKLSSFLVLCTIPGIFQVFYTILRRWSGRGRLFTAETRAAINCSICRRSVTQGAIKVEGGYCSIEDEAIDIQAQSVNFELGCVNQRANLGKVREIIVGFG